MDASLYWKQQWCLRCQEYVAVEMWVSSRPVKDSYRELVVAKCRCGQFLWAQAERRMMADVI